MQNLMLFGMAMLVTVVIVSEYLSVYARNLYDRIAE